MPTYVYKREDGSTFEIVQKISEEALKTCPETGQPVKRVISGGGGVVYKGDGWYVTDYKNKSTGNNGTASPESGQNKAESGSNGSASGTESTGNTKNPAKEKQSS